MNGIMFAILISFGPTLSARYVDYAAALTVRAFNLMALQTLRRAGATGFSVDRRCLPFDYVLTQRNKLWPTDR